jgi:uncharacterized protein
MCSKIHFLSSTAGHSLLIVLLLSLLGQVKGQNAKKEPVKAPKIDLHTAVMTNNIEAVKQHINAGSKLDEKEPMGGSSPLVMAAAFGKTEIAKLLIQAGASLKVQNNDGSTALHNAAFFCRPEIVKMLLNKGADKKVKNKYGQTPRETVTIPFAEVKGFYQQMATMLEPLGVVLDLSYIEKTRPKIAALLK